MKKKTHLFATHVQFVAKAHTRNILERENFYIYRYIFTVADKMEERKKVVSGIAFVCTCVHRRLLFITDISTRRRSIRFEPPPPGRWPLTMVRKWRPVPFRLFGLAKGDRISRKMALNWRAEGWREWGVLCAEMCVGFLVNILQELGLDPVCRLEELQVTLV